MRTVLSRSFAAVAAVAVASSLVAAQRGGRGDSPFPGGTNPDGSLRPTPPVTRLFFTQDAYTEYALLDPATASFRIKFLPEEARVGATELVNATRGGSEGSDIEVTHGRDIVWVRSLAGYRLGVLLPKGFAFISSNVAAQLSTSARART